MVVISDDLNHTKYSIYIFMQCIFHSLIAKFPNVELIDVFSDGPTSQFKQQYLFSNLHSWEQEQEVTIKWNFFATSHGKGVVDGIGETVKRVVWRHIQSEKSHINTPHEYAMLAKNLCPNIEVKFIPKSDVDMQTAFLDARWDGVMAVPRTHSVHCIQACDADNVKVADVSDDIERASECVKFETPFMILLLLPVLRIHNQFYMQHWTCLLVNGWLSSTVVNSFQERWHQLKSQMSRCQSCTEVLMHGNGRNQKTKSFIQGTALCCSKLSTHRVL